MLHIRLRGFLSQMLQDGYLSDEDYHQLLKEKKEALQRIDELLDKHQEGEPAWISEQIDGWLAHAMADFHVLAFLVEVACFRKVEGVFIEGMCPLNKGPQLTFLGRKVVDLLNKIYCLDLYGYKVEIINHPYGPGQVLQFFPTTIPP